MEEPICTGGIISSDHESEDREYHKQIYFQGSFWFYLNWLLYLFCLIPVYVIYGACLSLPFRSISFHSSFILRVQWGISASRFCWFWSKISKKHSEITVLLPVNTALLLNTDRPMASKCLFFFFFSYLAREVHFYHFLQISFFFFHKFQFYIKMEKIVQHPCHHLNLWIDNINILSYLLRCVYMYIS